MNIPYTQPPQPASSRATAALVLGILGFLLPCCIPLPPVAWYVGSQELKAIQAGLAPAAGEGIAKAGWILGIIGTVFAALFLFWILLAGGMTVLSAFLSSHSS